MTGEVLSPDVVQTIADAETTDRAEPVKPASGGLFQRMRRTRQALGDSINKLLGSGARVDEALFDDIEDQLLLADVGIDAASNIVTQLRERARREKVEEATDLKRILREEMVKILTDPTGKNGVTVDSQTAIGKNHPHVLLMVGVNGVGKTTSVAKLAARAKGEGKSVMLAAADTFRAAAIEQLSKWGQDLDVPVVSQAHGSDAAAVVHDALSAAIARSCDLLIIDTAGRQHTHSDLMEQLAKIVRVLRKVDPTTPHETYIVVDAANGQNVLSQIKEFSALVPLTGVVVTKLDGTARGGVVLAVSSQFKLPVRFIGVGETLEDLRAFEPTEFVEALIPD